MPILTPDEIMRFPQGKCVITNPGYSSGGEGSIPYPLTIPIPQSDFKRIEQSGKLWDEQVCPRLLARSRLVDSSQLDDAIDLRKQIAEQLLATVQHQQTQTEVTSQPQTLVEEEEKLVTLESPW